MSHRIVEPLCLSLGLLLGASAWAGTEVVYSCTGADGTVELSNTPSGDNCEQLIAAAVPAAPAPTGVPVATVPAAEQQTSDQAAAADPSGETPVETRLAQYRETMLQGAAASAAASSAPAAAMNPAISRRYLMVNRAAYMSTLGTGQ